MRGALEVETRFPPRVCRGYAAAGAARVDRWVRRIGRERDGGNPAAIIGKHAGKHTADIDRLSKDVRGGEHVRLRDVVDEVGVADNIAADLRQRAGAEGDVGRRVPGNDRIDEL